MQAVWGSLNTRSLGEPNWNRMLIASVVFHLVLFSAVIFVPESMPTRRISGPVYEVNLVEMPAASRPAKVVDVKKARAVKPSPRKKAVPVPAKRITVPTVKEKPVVIAKRVVESNAARKEKPKVSPTKMIDKAVSKIRKEVDAKKKDTNLIEDAVSRIEKNVKKQEVDHVGQAVAKLENNKEAGSGGPGGGTLSGISFRWYQMSVEEKIKGNWSYPVDLANPKKDKDIEAIVLVQVRNDGTILDFSLTKRSSNVMFDQSVLKAVERSDPLPPFPEGYRKSRDELEINFNLRDLEAE